MTGTHLVHGSFLGYIAEATSREVEGASCRDTSAFFCDCNLGPYSGSFRSPKPLAFSSHRTWHSTAFLALTLILTLTLTLSLTLTHRVQRGNFILSRQRRKTTVFITALPLPPRLRPAFWPNHISFRAKTRSKPSRCPI